MKKINNWLIHQLLPAPKRHAIVVLICKEQWSMPEYGEEKKYRY
jgi:hypothetical protein